MNQITFLIALLIALLVGLYIYPENRENAILSTKLNKKQEKIVSYVLEEQLKHITNVINNVTFNLEPNNLKHLINTEHKINKYLSNKTIINNPIYYLKNAIKNKNVLYSLTKIFNELDFISDNNKIIVQLSNLNSNARSYILHITSLILNLIIEMVHKQINKKNKLQLESCILQIFNKDSFIPLHKDNEYFDEKTNKFISFNKKLYTTILFINDPKEYTGGEITIYPNNKYTNISPGSILIFNSGELYKMNKISSGEMKCVYTWFSL